MTSDAGSAAAAGMAPLAAAAPAAAAKGKQPARRKQPLTLPEMRSKAAFRACDRLMERGAESQEQLWAVARVMSGEEYEQAAEERALAGKCGNPFCTHPPASSSSSPARGRYHIAAGEQAVYEVAAQERPVYCSPDCQVAVKKLAARLGSGALALDRFTAVYDELKRREAEVNAAAKQVQQAELQQPAQQQGDQVQQPLQEAAQQTQAASAAASSGAPAADSNSSSSSSSSSTCAGGADSGPGGICSDTPLVPRLAVEQVEVKHIDSSAGQFGDFSRKLKQRPAGEAAGAAPRPKGVLKKQSQFAAGTSKVPIMLAEVKERDLSLVEAETARNLPAEEQTAAAPAPARCSAKAAVAVEGYVPRAINSQRQRRVRWSDEVEGRSEEPSPDRRSPERQEAAEQPSAEPSAEQPPRPAEEVAAGADGAAPAALEQQQGGTEAAGTSGSVFVFELEDRKGPLEAGGLSAQMGRLRVADPSKLPGGAAASAAASSAAGVRSSARSLSPGGSSHSSPSPSRSPVSSSIDIQRREFVVPPEWRDAPQFYAHSPVGSSGSLAGSLSSPYGSNSNLAAIAGAVSSPPKRPPVASPPGLPRPPSRGGSGGASRLGTAQPQRQDASSSSSSQTGGPGQPATEAAQRQQVQPQPDAQQQQPQPEQQAAEGPALTRRQAEQLQRAFPGLSATLPPELQAMLASDSEAESGGEEEEQGSDWMHSDDEQDASSGEDEDGLVGPAGRSGYRIQISFFGTLFTHLEAWVTPNTIELLAAGPSVELVLPPPPSPEVLSTLSRFLAQALPPVLSSLQASAPRNEVERSLEELLRTLRLVGPLPAFKVSQWQVVVVLLLKALSLERCPALRPSFETRDGITRLNRLLGSLSFTSEEFYAVLELLCSTE